jgi:tRNA(Arg) A34 adenosine deaminase TadA
MSDRNGLLEKYMIIAIREAEISLRTGNHGFGAVIVKDNEIIAQEHDTDETDNDPTAHAEMKAIRRASSVLGKDLTACTLVSTHEPCPMCAGAIVWSQLKHFAYGFGIVDALVQGRNRIEMTCEEIFNRSKVSIHIQKDLLKAQCAVLYDRRVRTEIRKLRGAPDRALTGYNEDSKRKRIEWYLTTKPHLAGAEPLRRAYELILRKLDIEETEAPIIKEDGHRIVFHSMNYCPTLEACRILQLDTRRVCKLYNENATQELIRQIDPRLTFTRNYNKLRPYTEYCEEVIALGG